MTAPTCRGCRAVVRYVLGIHGRRIALDPTPHPDGTVVLQPNLLARVLTGDQLPAQTEAYREHRCGQAPRLCRVCQQPTSDTPVHPLCQPDRAPRPARTALVRAPEPARHEQEALPL